MDNNINDPFDLLSEEKIKHTKIIFNLEDEKDYLTKKDLELFDTMEN